MTRITIFDKNGYTIGFILDGHSGYAEEGSDIVCAGLSALAIAGANALEKVAEVKPDVEIKDAYFRVMLPKKLSHEDIEKADIVMRTVTLGFSSIADEYPTYVSIKNGGANND